MVFSFVEHPKTTGVGIGMLSMVYPYQTNDWTPYFWTSVTPAYAAYLALGILKDHMLHSQYGALPLVGKERIKEIIFNHTKESSLGVGIACAAAYEMIGSQHGAFVEQHPPLTIFEYATQIIFPTTTALTQVGLIAYKQYDRIMNAVRTWKEQQQEKDLVEKIWNFPFEHPVIGGIVVGATTTMFALPEDKSGNSTVENAIALLVGIYAAALTTYGTAIAGGVLHSSSLSLHKYRAKAFWHKIRGEREKEVKSLEKTLTIPTSHAMLIERHLRLADKLWSHDQPEEAAKHYQQAALLFSHPENRTLSSADLLQSMVFLGQSSVKNKFRRVGESMNEVVEYTPSRRARQRFIFKRGKNPVTIEKEYDINRACERICKAEHTGIQPPTSIACFDGPDNLTYHVMLRDDASSLEQYVIPRGVLAEQGIRSLELQNTEQIQHHSRLIARLHADVTKHVHIDSEGCFLEGMDGKKVRLHQREYQEEFLSRVIRGRGYDTHPRLGSVKYTPEQHPEIKAFVDAAGEYFSPLEKYKGMFTHGDLALRHFFMNGTLIDFEHAALGNPFVDLAGFYLNTLANPSHFITPYLEEMKSRSGRIFPDANEQMERAWLYQAFCQAGTMLGRMPTGMTNRMVRHFRIQRWSDLMGEIMFMMQQEGLDDLQTKFLKALEQGDLKKSPYFDYRELLANFDERILMSESHT
ncbi:MAG: hypothetical protein AABX72_02350 [Nanoarchaeota archaeon]